MKVLCVQCMKLNDLPDDAPPGEDGKIRFPCPSCSFVTVVTRKKAKSAPAQKSTGSAPQRPAPANRTPAPRPSPPPEPERRKPQRLEDEIFDGSEKEVGDWMVRRLDGTEAGPLTFEELKQMIREGDIGKIDEVRRMEERYVPAAFHEQTAELFNELDMAGVGPPPKRG